MQDIENVLIVGAGTMGHSLALLFARGGFEVNLADEDQAALEKAINLIDSARKTLVTETIYHRFYRKPHPKGHFSRSLFACRPKLREHRGCR